ncbi:MAG TPA: FAD-binding oxidoreductase [Candidatus Pelagibacter bacterium]|nr:FAD-binding oxidoreductase [Candidatus Pelagibacter bacterium]
MTFPTKAKYVIIGAGIHGLSTAWHLAEKIKKNGNGSNNDIVVIDKGGISSGASGIACGVVRNNYYQPAMRELMAHSVKIWESDPKKFSYHPVGYMQISPESMRKDVTTIYEQQKAIGYESTFIEGEKDSTEYMKNMFDDWQAQGITSVLHEKKGGYANNSAAIYGMADKAEALGVNIITGTEVTGFKRGSNSKAVTGVETTKGTIDCEQVVVGAGPWVKTFWDKLELPNKISITDEKGKRHENFPMWKYWFLTEGVLGVDPNFQKTNDGKMPPVIHVDSDAPLYSDVDKSLITDKMWGIYYKPDFNFNGLQGGTAPYKINKAAEDVKVDPYGIDSPEYQTTDEFAHMWCSALAHCQKRFEGKIKVYQKGPSGGLGCFTPDSFPIFDRFCENVYFIADSNHGYKMIGVGELVADEMLGTERDLLKPFRFNRYEKGELHPSSSSPFPWS